MWLVKTGCQSKHVDGEGKTEDQTPEHVIGTRVEMIVSIMGMRIGDQILGS